MPTEIPITLTPTPSPAPHGGNAYSEILEKGVSILAARSGEGFFTKRIENKDNSAIEKYSLSDVASFMQAMKKMSDAENAEKNSENIYKPISFRHAR